MLLRTGVPAADHRRAFSATEDLEAGRADLRPERSDNFNLNLSYDGRFGKHGLYADVSLIYRNTKDYIKRGLGKHGSTQYGIYENHGHVRTKGYNVSLRYSFARWFDLGGTWNSIDTRDYERRWTGVVAAGEHALQGAAAEHALPVRQLRRLVPLARPFRPREYAHGRLRRILAARLSAQLGEHRRQGFESLRTQPAVSQPLAGLQHPKTDATTSLWSAAT